jgi:hypothetical protein
MSVSIVGNSFLKLKDTPSSYSGQAGKLSEVKSTEDGLDFIDAAPIPIGRPKRDGASMRQWRKHIGQDYS